MYKNEHTYTNTFKLRTQGNIKDRKLTLIVHEESGLTNI